MRRFVVSALAVLLSANFDNDAAGQVPTRRPHSIRSRK